MKLPLLAAAALLLTAGCSKDHVGESPDCRRYKAALLKHHRCDLEFTPPAVDDGYGAYRCPAPEEFVVSGDLKSSAACADYLEGMLDDAGQCSIPLDSDERLLCKDTLLLADRSARTSNEGVGDTCAFANPPPVGPQSDETLIEVQNESCPSQLCLVRRGSGDSGSYCTCRCDAAEVDHPSCECPSGFACLEDALTVPGVGPGLRGGYCVRD